MRIQSIRLKNIKSYGAGPEGRGITITFGPGVNRVTGRNGHGKTTLIEAIGYTLFMVCPPHEEKFDTKTYFLRHGTTEGEMEITYAHGDDLCRITRFIGTTQRRDKVTTVADGSIAAEGHEEVAAFLREQMQVPNSEVLGDIFCKLVGVKQGRLTWPFDSKPSEAKTHFEPVLGVAIFRKCFEHLKGVLDLFAQEQTARERDLAAVCERVRAHDSSPENLGQARHLVEATLTELNATKNACAHADKTKKHLEQAKLQTEQAHRDGADARGKLALAQTQRETAKHYLDEAVQAEIIVAQTRPDHGAYLAADHALAELNEKRRCREELRLQQGALEKQITHHHNAASNARAQAAEFHLQHTAKQTEESACASGLAQLRIEVETLNTTARRAASTIQAIQTHRDAASRWIEGKKSKKTLLDGYAHSATALAAEIAQWDEARLAQVLLAESEAEDRLREAQELLARAQQRQAVLREQSQAIAHGICPFLKETCRQFDAAKVQADLDAQSTACTAQKQVLDHAQKQAKTAKATAAHYRTAKGTMEAKRNEARHLLAQYGEGFAALAQGLDSEVLAGLMALVPGAPPPPRAPAGWGWVGLADVQAAATVIADLMGQWQAWWNTVDQALRESTEEWQKQVRAHASQHSILKEREAQQTRVTQEIRHLSEQKGAKETEAAQHTARATPMKEQLAVLETKLKGFDGLDAAIQQEDARRETHRTGYEQCLGAQKVAAERAPRQSRWDQAQAGCTAAQAAVFAAEACLLDAEKAFDPEKLQAAQGAYQELRDTMVRLDTQLQNGNKALEQAQARFAEWEKACGDRDRLNEKIGRCQASADLINLARTTLKHAAAKVAEHLCAQIAQRAQYLFNQINPEPVDLEWKAENYSLRISPDHRHFAMLSGGEQTKLSLAMTIAMIEKFSALQFCIFDEPTYGVDAESRRKLAEAILQVQEAANLDQLLLVSHDDAFEGKIEHVITLTKSASHGSSPIPIP